MQNHKIKIASIALIISYPLLVHAYSATDITSLLWLAIGAFSAVLILALYRFIKLSGCLLFACVVFSLSIIGADELGQTVLKLTPVIINASLASIFLYTMMAGRTPIITRFARMIGDELDEPTMRYTKGVTLFWGLCFIVLAVESAILAVWAPIQTWSLITGFVNYLLVGILFPIEFALRRHFLPHQTRQGFYAFVKSLVRADFRELFTDK